MPAAISPLCRLQVLKRSLAWLALLLLCVPLTPTHADQHEGQSLTEFRQLLEGSFQPLGEQVAEIDQAPAQRWSTESPAETAREKLAIPTLSENEALIWQEVLQLENEGDERLKRALERAAQTRDYAQRLHRAEAHLLDILSRIEAAADDQVPRSLPQIQAEIRQLRMRQSLLRSELEQKQQAMQQLDEQSKTQHAALEPLRQEIEELSLPTEQEEPSAFHEAHQARQLAIQRLAEARMLALQLEQQLLPASMTILQLELDALEHELRLLNPHLQQVESEFQRRSTEELRELGDALQRLEARGPETLTRFEGELQGLHERLDNIATHHERMRSLQGKLTGYLDHEARLSQTLRGVHERMEISSLSEALRLQFLEEQKRLGEFIEARHEIPRLERELTQSRLRVISLREERRDLLAELADVDDPALMELRQLRTRVLEAQLGAEVQLAEQIRQNELALQAAIKRGNKLDQLLRETLLWWPSHTSVGIDWLRHFPKATVQLFNASDWQGLTRTMEGFSWVKSLTTLLFLLLLVVLWRWGTHATKRAEETAHHNTASIRPTFLAIGAALLKALPIPLLLLTAAFHLEGSPEATPAAEVLAQALSHAAGWWLAGHLLLLFTTPHGVGTVHFQWNTLLAQRIHHGLTWFLPAQLLLVILLALTLGHPKELIYDTFGRIALLLLVGLITLLTWRLLAPAGSEHGGFFPSGKRRLLRLALSGLFVLMMGLILGGYLLTVAELMPRITNTLILLSLIWLLSSLAVRMQILSENRLRIKRTRNQPVRVVSDESGTIAAADGEGKLPDAHPSIENINLQMRTLLSTATVGSIVIALLWVWADVLPALSWLDSVQLWSRSIMSGETEIIQIITMQDLLLALLLGGLFILAAMNLPGLVEVLLAHSKLADATHSYAVATLLRYGLAVVAVVVVFSLLGLRWSELQWMVAALTLGVGFGLQAVVINFVSGLIILFERPIRVGDTITVGEYSGKVARIRTRATTIIDWDNREVVVPNKTFITERLINWTLTDNITRLVIPVGASYNSNPEQVLAILAQVAADHPMVLNEPEPSVYFVEVTDNSLKFELRVYVSQMKERLLTKSELLVAIIKSFREAGIEIAYPQMDLHIRDLPTPDAH